MQDLEQNFMIPEETEEPFVNTVPEFDEIWKAYKALTVTAQNYKVRHRKKLREIMDVPRNFSQINGRDDAHLWLQAYQKELDCLETIGKMTVVSRQEAIQARVKVIPLREIFTIKFDNVLQQMKYKVRICARGDLVRTSNLTFAPVANMECIRLFFILVQEFNFKIKQADVSTAFLFASTSKWRFLELPQGHPTKQGKMKVWKTKCAIYGLKDSPRLWNSHLHKILIVNGYRQHFTLPCLYYTSNIIIVVYVDDIVCASSKDECLQVFERCLQRDLNIKTNNQVHDFLGMEITRQVSSRLSAEALAANILQQANGKASLRCTLNIVQTKRIQLLKTLYEIDPNKRADTPMQPGLDLLNTREGSTLLSDKRLYQSIVGSLMFIYNTTRPDIGYAVH